MKNYCREICDKMEIYSKRVFRCERQANMESLGLSQQNAVNYLQEIKRVGKIWREKWEGCCI